MNSNEKISPRHIIISQSLTSDLHASAGIPNFPMFKMLELSDRSNIELFTSRHKPYSAFNFTNLWAWNIKDDRRISVLNGNLVVYSTDYHTNEPFLSFIGTQEVDDTIHKLLQFAEGSGCSSELRFLTEETVELIQNPNFIVAEDRDNFDYLYSVPFLADPSHSGLRTKKRSSDIFRRRYQNAIFEFRDFNKEDTKKLIMETFCRWREKKEFDNKKNDSTQEECAIKRLMVSSCNHRLMLSCVVLDNVMLGFGIDEILPNNNALSHFVKADISYRGIYEYLNENIAQQLLLRDVVFWNWQQDLNIQGLRNVKISYHPVGFLKRYTVSKKNIK